MACRHHNQLPLFAPANPAFVGGWNRQKPTPPVRPTVPAQHHNHHHANHPLSPHPQSYYSLDYPVPLPLMAATTTTAAKVLLPHVPANSGSNADDSYYHNGGDGGDDGCDDLVTNPYIGTDITSAYIHHIITNRQLPPKVSCFLQLCCETWMLDASHEQSVREMELSRCEIYHAFGQMLRMDRQGLRYLKNENALQWEEQLKSRRAFRLELDALCFATREKCRIFNRWMTLRCDRIESFLGSLTKGEREVVDYHRRVIFNLEHIRKEEYGQ